MSFFYMHLLLYSLFSVSFGENHLRLLGNGRPAGPDLLESLFFRLYIHTNGAAILISGGILKKNPCRSLW